MVEATMIEPLRHAGQVAGGNGQRQDEQAVFECGLHNWLFEDERLIF
jgi:hypothetical protein